MKKICCISVLLVSLANSYCQTSEAYFASGIKKIGLKDTSGAKADFTSAIALDSTMGKAYYFSGKLKSGSDDYQGAIVDLTKAIAINPQVMNGAGYVVLGTLYDKVPSWPIGFGDDNTAKSLLETALKINPNGIVSNYFYGQFLLTHDDEQAAERYFNKALAAPVRAEQMYADSQMRHNVERELKKLHPLSQRSH